MTVFPHWPLLQEHDTEGQDCRNCYNPSPGTAGNLRQLQSLVHLTLHTFGILSALELVPLGRMCLEPLVTQKAQVVDYSDQKARQLVRPQVVADCLWHSNLTLRVGQKFSYPSCPPLERVSWDEQLVVNGHPLV